MVTAFLPEAASLMCDRFMGEGQACHWGQGLDWGSLILITSDGVLSL